MNDGAVGKLHVSGHGHGDADGLAALAALPGDGGGDAEDDQVEADPDQVHHNGADVVAVVHSGEQVQWRGQICAGKLEEPWNRAEDAEKFQADHEEEWPCEMAVEESAVDDAALRGDVEAAQF